VSGEGRGTIRGHQSSEAMKQSAARWGSSLSNAGLTGE
jgi:hypothetical protein